MGMSWCVAVAQPNCERRAETNLIQQGFTPYLPRVKQRVVRNGQKMFLERLLFGRYFFVKLESCWRSIMATRGVSSIILNGEMPSIVPDVEINNLKAREKDGAVQLRKQPRFAVGASIRVDSGELVGFVGLYNGMSSRDREVVLLNMMGRWVSTELAAGDELISA